jgi:predicted acyltransferase
MPATTAGDSYGNEHRTYGGPRALRLASVDALRGITVAAMLLVNNPGDWGHVYAPLRHADWHGCTPTDLIFPMFLFIVGVSIALAILPRREAGTGPSSMARAVSWRGSMIIALGLLLHVLAWWWLDLAWFRPWGVLQRIGLCFIVVGWLAVYTGERTQWGLIAAVLAGYALALLAGGSLQPWVNLPSRVDTALFAPFLYQFDPATGQGHDPEGLLSTVPAVATTLLGLRLGDWLRRGRGNRLLPAGAVLLALAALCSVWLPINKPLWTPSYVLWTAGWAALALWACHHLIDCRGWPAWGRRFGVNAIAAYAGAAVMVYALAGLGGWQPLYATAFAGWMTPWAGPYLPSLLFALAFVVLWWSIVRVMDKRGWYLKL